MSKRVLLRAGASPREIPSERRRTQGLFRIGLVIAACSSKQTAEPTVSLRDSAGISIVESRSPSSPADAVWRVDTTPSLVLGTVDGPAETQFTDIRGVVLLSDGRIVVASGRTQDLRCFSSSGEFLWTSGRPGQGPGDFLQLSSILPYRGDSIIAFDFGLQRYSIVSAAGRYARSWTPEIPEEVDFYRNLALEGSWPDGSVAIRHSPVRRGMSPPQVTRRPLRLYRYSPEGRLLGRMGEFAGAEWYEGEGFGIRPLPYGRGTRFAVTPSGVLAGTDDTWEVRELALDGSVHRIIRHVITPRLIEAAVADAERERLRLVRRSERAKTFRGMPDSILSWIAASEERMYDDLRFPLSYPAFGRFLLATDSSLWVEEYRAPSDSGRTAQWSVHDRDGRWLSLIVLPARFTLYSVTGDRVIGVQRDDMDVESVVALRVIRK